MRSPQAGQTGITAPGGCTPSAPLAPAPHTRLWALPRPGQRLSRRTTAAAAPALYSSSKGPDFSGSVSTGHIDKCPGPGRPGSQYSVAGGISATLGISATSTCVHAQNFILPRAWRMPGMTFNKWKTRFISKALSSNTAPNNGQLERCGCSEADPAVSRQLLEKGKVDPILGLVAGLAA